ncbi:hypothetical protein [Gallaecimonas pentaromativorans]|uniref:Uncharacterized protein n=1 Tax=Gallaecimonas pentaromativorans TaxID=584787 RepID=A0A3N1NSS7_9GAMM|nr:hypothetical protein [Gallaecimonas pentaromativorans]ROQ19203.1 hypothetical protein EDC28_112126 [Gallaecimonas pentaromativorans]
MGKTPLVCCLALASFMAVAGDVEEAIKAGQDAYQQGQLSEAANQFSYAATLIRQQQGDKMVKLFPAPLKGWQADDAESESAGAAMLGGGVTGSRLYHKGDDISLELKIIKDSPLVQAMAGLFTNPNMAAMAGYKIKKINGVSAMLKTDDEMSLTMMDGTVLVQMECSECQSSDLEDYAKALDMGAIKQL